MLPIGVHGDDVVIPSLDNLNESAQQRCAVSTVLRLHDDAGVVGLKLLQHLRRAVNGTVIHKEHIPGIHLPQSTKEARKMLLLVKDGYEDDSPAHAT